MPLYASRTQVIEAGTANEERDINGLLQCSLSIKSCSCKTYLPLVASCGFYCINVYRYKDNVFGAGKCPASC